jgi:hypothetical protein
MKISISINPEIINKNENNANMGYLPGGYRSITIPEFVQVIKAGIAWTPGKYIDNHRIKSNFIQTNIIGIDIDHGLLLQDVFKDPFVLNNALLLYTSFQHTNEAHRFRIIFKLTKIIKSIKAFETIAKVLIQYFNADKQCKDVTRLFYGNTKAKVKYFGKTLNLNNLHKIEVKSKIKEDEIPKHIIAQSKNISQLELMLFRIKESIPKLAYEKWITICSSIWSEFTLQESLPILNKYYPEEKEGEYKYKYEHRLKTIPYTYILKLAVSNGYELPEYQDFVRIDNDGKFCTSPAAIEDFLYENGIYTYFDNENGIDFRFIEDQHNILKEIGIKKICEFMKNYVIKNYAKNDSENIRNFLVQRNMISPSKLNYLSSPDLKFHKDTIHTAYFYFQNGYLEITKNKMLFHDSYNKLNPFKVWGSSLKKYKFQLDNTKSDFERFIYNISHNDQDRIDAMFRIIGYLLHRYKNPNINKCVVLNDEIINIDNPSGRTGKTLIATALSHIRSLVQIDGKQFDSKDRFKFQNVNLSTELIHIDDVNKNFNLKNFYSILTGEFKIEKKGETAILKSFENSPKFIFSSNYTVDTGGGSDRARVIEVPLYNYYNEYRQPKHEFGKLFFQDWDNDEWNQFFTFCAMCVQEYLQHGLLCVQNNQLLINKLTKQTNQKFAMWIDSYNFYQEDKTFFSKKELFLDFSRFCKTDFDQESITQHLFTKWIKIYFNIMEIHFQEKRKITINQQVIWGFQIMR